MLLNIGMLSTKVTGLMNLMPEAPTEYKEPSNKCVNRENRVLSEELKRFLLIPNVRRETPAEMRQT